MIWVCSISLVNDILEVCFTIACFYTRIVKWQDFSLLPFTLQRDMDVYHPNNVHVITNVIEMKLRIYTKT